MKVQCRLDKVHQVETVKYTKSQNKLHIPLEYNPIEICNELNDV